MGGAMFRRKQGSDLSSVTAGTTGFISLSKFPIVLGVGTRFLQVGVLQFDIEAVESAVRGRILSDKHHKRLLKTFKASAPDSFSDQELQQQCDRLLHCSVRLVQSMFKFRVYPGFPKTFC